MRGEYHQEVLCCILHDGFQDPRELPPRSGPYRQKHDQQERKDIWHVRNTSEINDTLSDLDNYNHRKRERCLCMRPPELYAGQIHTSGMHQQVLAVSVGLHGLNENGPCDTRDLPYLHSLPQKSPNIFQAQAGQS